VLVWGLGKGGFGRRGEKVFGLGAVEGVRVAGGQGVDAGTRAVALEGLGHREVVSNAFCGVYTDAVLVTVFVEYEFPVVSVEFSSLDFQLLFEAGRDFDVGTQGLHGILAE